MRQYLKWLEPLVGLGLFGLALAGLQRELAGHGLREITHTLRALPPARVVAALGLALVGYAVLTLYDYLAVRYAERRLHFRTVAPASFVSYALSHNLGMAALTSVPMRFRFYSAAGLGPGEIARIVVFVNATFWLGVVTLGGIAFVSRGDRGIDSTGPAIALGAGTSWRARDRQGGSHRRARTRHVFQPGAAGRQVVSVECRRQRVRVEGELF